jgi:hypothetical protein
LDSSCGFTADFFEAKELDWQQKEKVSCCKADIIMLPVLSLLVNEKGEQLYETRS